MAEELQVIVQQEVGVINWNFEQLKNALAVKMNEYEGIVYTEDTVKVAKADIASLRKLKKAISDKRVEIKNKCLEPYTIIEAQAAELTELIDKPIAQIDVQLTEYEKNRREEVKAKIMEYFDEVGGELPESILSTIKVLKYKSEWENATMAVKRRKQGVEDAVRAVKRDLDSINEFEEEFREAALSEYSKRLDINDAVTEVNKARRQKEIILAKERERIAAEERAKAEAEMRAKLAENRPVPVQPVEQVVPNTPSDVREATKSLSNDSEATIPSPRTQNRVNGANLDSNAKVYNLRIKATPEQYAKIKGYISYCGAVYREVES